MRLTTRDYVAAGLGVAIAVPYAGYLVNGEMPFIQDARGMAATGLVLGVAAFLVFRRGGEPGGLSKLDRVLFAASAVLGVVALIVAETAAAQVLLAVFMGSVLVVLVIGLMEHAGILHADHGVRTAHG
jgi:hypothetical protein